MTAEEAMRISENTLAKDIEDIMTDDVEWKELYECIDNALEKQIPKKPIDVHTPVVTWGLCPVCKGKLNKLGGSPNRVFFDTNYCPDCGQRLDWTEIDTL